MADGNAHRRIETGELTGVNMLNPYLQGLYEPVAKEVTALDLKVIGEIPKDLHGAYYRNGPNPAQAPSELHHWFDGDGMLHAVYFENGKAEYRNRYVRSDDFRADREGRGEARGVLLPANRARANKVYKDTANTDVIIHNGQLMRCGTFPARRCASIRARWRRSATKPSAASCRATSPPTPRSIPRRASSCSSIIRSTSRG